MRGRDIKRYSFEFANLYLITTFPSLKIDINEFSAVKNFLKGFKPKIKQTGEKLTIQEIQSIISHGKKYGIEINMNSLKKSRKKTNNKWFETQDSIDYWEDFDKQKVGWKAVGRNLSFSIIDEGVFITAPAAFFSSKHNKYILTFLLSSFGKYYIYNNSDTTGAGDIMLNIQSLQKIPIPKIKDENNQLLKTLVDEIIKIKSKKKETTHLEEKINAIIFSLFQFTNEEIKFIKSN